MLSFAASNDMRWSSDVFRDDCSSEVEFIRLLADLRQFDALGFLNGYRQHLSKDAEKKVMSA